MAEYQVTEWRSETYDVVTGCDLCQQLYLPMGVRMFYRLDPDSLTPDDRDALEAAEYKPDALIVCEECFFKRLKGRLREPTGKPATCKGCVQRLINARAKDTGA